MSVVPGRKISKAASCFLCGRASAFEGGYSGFKIGAMTYDIRFCGGCGLGMTSPFPGEKELKDIYSGSYREGDSTRFFSPVERCIRVFRVLRCRKVEGLSKKGKVLDVGCGRGDFLALMAGRGWRCSGLELDKRIEARGREAGLDLRAGSLDDIRFPDGVFDAVTFWHVFEHIRNPEEAVLECGRILKPGGLLVIAVPNTGSMQARLSGGHWFHLDPPFHLYHYSLENLRSLLDRSGFRVSRVRHFSLEYNPYGCLQSVFNACGFRHNLLYDFLRSKAEPGPSTYLSLALIFLLMPLVLPLSVMFSIFEAAMGRGGTIEVYAKKTGGPGDEEV